ncbi:Lipase 2 [Mycena venus]|uniref:Lipase 2 n=1 Tax=Mycena venus TaxID=2733690 RepID=A0A8H6XJL5_9AGAR|nr:Lipase 2 [Mycena venus]
MDSTTNAGVTTFGYLFTQPRPPALLTSLGVFHASELFQRAGSFATSLNQRRSGIPRPKWKEFTGGKKALIRLNGANLTVIPDDFRAEQSR